jgi:hypothetical protein
VSITGPTGGQALVFNGATGANRWQNTVLTLNSLTGVQVPANPVDGAVLVYSAAAGGWRALNEARFDYVFLTTDDDEFSIFSQRGETGASTHSARLDLGLLPLGVSREYLFPNASGTFALQNQFTMLSVNGPTGAVPAGTFLEAFATCPAGSKPVGVGVSAFPPVTIQDMRIWSSTQVRVRAWRADQSQVTVMNAVAYCMSQP